MYTLAKIVSVVHAGRDRLSQLVDFPLPPAIIAISGETRSQPKNACTRLLGALSLVADPSRGIALCRHSYSSMLITNIEIGTINGEVVEVAINVVVW